MTLAQDIASLSERFRHFNRAIEASKANDQRAFDEAINAFWQSKGRERQRFGDNPLPSDR